MFEPARILEKLNRLITELGVRTFMALFKLMVASGKNLAAFEQRKMNL
jgi:hypothetical protein